MRRLIANTALAIALAVVGGSFGINSGVHAHGACTPLTEDSLRTAVEDASVIVIGSIAEGPSSGSVQVVPERYFKGTAESRSFLLREDALAENCDPAALSPGDRMLLVLESTGNRLAWPEESRAFHLDDEVATNGADPPWVIPTAELAADIQDLTGQDSVPVEAGDEGEQIDWVGTVLPVAAALVVVFGIGLAMMRVWHRIDPS